MTRACCCRGDRPRRRRRVRRQPLPRLHHPGHRLDRDLLGDHLPRARFPTTGPLRAVTGFIDGDDVTPYLNLFRRFMPPIGRWRDVARPEPDDRPDPALRPAGDRRRPDQRVRASSPGFGRARGDGGRRRWRVSIRSPRRSSAARSRPVSGSTSSPAFDLVRVSNDGIAFGLLDDAGSPVLVLAAPRLRRPARDVPRRVGAARPLAADRPARRRGDRQPDRPDPRGAVTDFVDSARWPAFNLADVEITVGVIILVSIYAVRPAEPEAATERRR